MKGHRKTGDPLGRRRYKIAAGIGIALLLLLIQAVFQPFVYWGKEETGLKGEKRSIEAVLEKTEWNREDYAFLYQQTGLGKPALDQLRGNSHYKKEDILAFQESYFAKRKIQCCRGSLFTRQDKIQEDQDNPVLVAPLNDGDIFLSFSSHSLGWRHGHAGLLVDAEKNLCLEAKMPGCRSGIKSAEHWKQCSSFVILRLKGASAKQRKEIARYAKKHLTEIPYSLTSGLIGDRSGEEEHLTAQCAYLIWYAYKRFGYDLDSDGGKLVTVEDLLNSPDLEVVQSFGAGAGRAGLMDEF